MPRRKDADLVEDIRQAISRIRRYTRRLSYGRVLAGGSYPGRQTTCASGDVKVTVRGLETQFDVGPLIAEAVEKLRSLTVF